MKQSSDNVQYFEGLNNQSSVLGYNLDQIKTNWQEQGYILYNDQPWSDGIGIEKQKSYHSLDQLPYKSLAKGLLVWSTTGLFKSSGFSIKHTLPGFPVPIPNGFKSPKDHPTSWFPSDFMGNGNSDANSLGHSFFCHSFMNVETVADVLKGSHPFIYRTNSFPIPAPYDTSVPLKELFQNNNFNPLSYTLENGVQLIVSSTTQWPSLSVIPSANMKLNNFGYNIITEFQLSSEFSQQYSIPSKLQRWRSSIDRDHFGFSNNSNKFCFGDIYKNNLNYLSSETIICVNSDILSNFIKTIASKVRMTSNLQETYFNTPFVFKGYLKMLQSTAPFGPSSNHLTKYFESMKGDRFLGNTIVQFQNFTQSPIIYIGLSELMTVVSDSNGRISINKNYQPKMIILLHDQTLNLKIVSSGSIVSIPIVVSADGYLIPDQTTSKENNILFLYKVLQQVIFSAKEKTTGLPNFSLPPIDVHINTNLQAIINNLQSITIDINSFCIEDVLRAYSYALISQINPSYSTSSFTMNQYQFDLIGSDAYPPFLKGLVNSIAMDLRRSVFPNLPSSMLQSLSTCNGPERDIEHFDVTHIQSFDIYSSRYTEGWVTSYLWDLIDKPSQDDDSRMNDLYSLDDDSITINDLLLTISRSSAPTQDGIIQFRNNTIITIPNQQSIISRISLYNNIISCPNQNKCIPTTVDPFNLNSQFTSRGICLGDIDKFNQLDSLDRYLDLWAGKDMENGKKDWSKNRLFNVVYNSNFNQKYQQLLPYLKDESIECNLKLGDVASLELMSKVTSRLIELTYMAPNVYHYETLFSIFYLPPALPSQTMGLGIVTYGNRICNFDFIDYNDFSSGFLFNSCPIEPVVTKIVGLYGAPYKNTPITIYGRNLLDPNVVVKVGSKQCPISSRTDSHPPNQQMIICTGPKGLGVQPITVSNLIPSPLTNILPMGPYQFEYYNPVLKSIIYPTQYSIDQLLPTTGAILTITGNNFIDEIGNPNLLQSIEVKAGLKTHQVTSFYQTENQGTPTDHLVINAIGVGVRNLVEVIVENQSTTRSLLSNELELNFKIPEITATSLTTSPAKGGSRFTISGNNFAPSSDYFSIAYIGSQPCDDVTWLSPTQLVATVPEFYGKDKIISVEIANQVSEETHITLTYDPPQIYEIVHGELNTNEISQFWITGTNFATENFIPLVYLYNDPQNYTLECYVDGAVYKNKKYTDENGNPIPVPEQQDPDPEYYDPYIDLDKRYRDSVDFECIACSLPPGTGSNISFTLNLVSQEAYSFDALYQKGDPTQVLAYNKPHIFEISPMKFPTDGNVTLTITGKNFVSNEHVPYLNSFLEDDEEPLTSVGNGVQFDNVTIILNNTGFEFECTKDLVWNSSMLAYCTVPAGFGGYLNISLFIGEQQLDNFGEFKLSYETSQVNDPPQIKEYPLATEITINITGSNFVPEEWAERSNNNETLRAINKIYVKDKECTKVTWINSKSASCQPPLDSGANIPVKVLVGNQNSTEVVYFSYEKPKIHSVKPGTVRMSDKTDVTLKGFNFGNQGVNPDPIVKIDGVALSNTSCHPFTSRIEIDGQTKNNSNQIICSVGPFDKEKKGQVIVELNGQKSDPVELEIYGKPVIDSIVPSEGSVDGGYDITIKGKNLVEPDKGDPIVTMKSLPVMVKSKSKTEIVFTSVKGGGKSIKISIDLNGQTVDNSDFSYKAPYITSVVPSSSYTQQNLQINILGTDLGLTGLEEGSVTVKIGASPCTNLVVISSEQVKCLSPFGKQGVVQLVLKFEGQSSNNMPFNYYDRQTSTPMSTGTGGVGGILAAIAGLIIGFPIGHPPFGVAHQKQVGCSEEVMLFASVVTVMSTFQLENQTTTITSRMIGRVVGNQPNNTNPNSFGQLDGNTIIQNQQLEQKYPGSTIQDTIKKMSFTESKLAFFSVSDAQISQSANRLLNIELVKTEENYVLEYPTYYELSTTVTFVAKAIIDGKTYDKIFLSGPLYSIKLINSAPVGVFNGPEYSYGINGGYKVGWSNEKGNTLVGKLGITTNRMSFPKEFFERWGYNILYDNNSFKSSIAEGQSNFTAFLTSDKLPTGLHEPIWSSNGVANPNNPWAVFIFKVVSTYKKDVKIYEVWNEPDYIDDWRIADTWKTTAPTAAQLVRFGGSIYDYVRMLRVTYEVAKFVDPTCFIAPGGLGITNFMDAVLRYTDDPNVNDPKRTGGNWLDAMSLHFYPVFATNTPNSDNYVQWYVKHYQAFKAVCDKYNFKPSIWITTEVGVATKTTGNYPGSPLLATNFFLKLPSYSIQVGMRQNHIYVLGDETTNTPGPNTFMGLYYDFNNQPTATMKESSLCLPTWKSQMNDKVLDNDRTDTLQKSLPSGTVGFVYKNNTKACNLLWVSTIGANNDESVGKKTVTLSAQGDWIIYDWKNTPYVIKRKSDGNVELELSSTPIFAYDTGAEVNSATSNQLPFLLIVILSVLLSILF
eukprot:gene4566-5690_t